MTTHANCTHPATSSDRALCRKAAAAGITYDELRTRRIADNATDSARATIRAKAAQAPATIAEVTSPINPTDAPRDFKAERAAQLEATVKIGFTKLGMDEMPGVFPLTTCRGINHSDELQLGYCDGCGARVTRTHRRTLIDNWVRFCFGQAHTCDEARAEAHRAEQAALLEAGTIVKGARVIVARGRKVAKGTEGVVFWLGTDSYGNDKIGIRTDEDETHFTATKNCDLV